MTTLVKNDFMPAPQTMTEAMNYAKLVAQSAICPPQMKGKPGDVLAALQLGSEIGLSPLQAIQNVAVINGRPCVWGDAALAVIQASSAYEYHKEWVEEDEEGNPLEAHCIVKRKGQEEHHVVFSVADAKKAKLWGKGGPWTQYPKRMLQMRARSFAIRDQFADALRGIAVREEVMDYPKKNQKEDMIDITPEPTKEELDQATALLNNAETLEELKEVYLNLMKLYKNFPAICDSLVHFKDLRKGELEAVQKAQAEVEVMDE